MGGGVGIVENKRGGRDKLGGWGREEDKVFGCFGMMRGGGEIGRKEKKIIGKARGKGRRRKRGRN